MDTRYNVRKTLNGWVCERVITNDTGEYHEEVTGIDKDDADVEGFLEFLRDINDHFGPGQSRYDEKRINVITLPGDKFSGIISDEYRQELKELMEYIEYVLGEL